MESDYGVFSKYIGKKKLSKGKFRHFVDQIYSLDNFEKMNFFNVYTLKNDSSRRDFFEIIATIRKNMHIDQMLKIFPDNRCRFPLLSIWHMDQKKFMKMCREKRIFIDKSGNLFFPDKRPEQEDFFVKFAESLNIALKKNVHKSPNKKPDLAGFNGINPRSLLFRAIEEIHEALIELDETGLSVHFSDEIADAACFLMAASNLAKR